MNCSGINSVVPLFSSFHFGKLILLRCLREGTDAKGNSGGVEGRRGKREEKGGRKDVFIRREREEGRRVRGKGK